ncbi:MAG: hypothetical protein LBH20_09010 [Treponema sp.]|jgi:ABC-type Fe3+ transport system permease subunit|nr:hypothetical protein [Treponema sp.]
MFFLILISIATLAGIIYLAVSPQSNFKLKITALIALALMIATVIICLVFFFKSAATPKIVLLPDMDPSDLPPMSTGHNAPTLVMFVIFLIALFVMVVILSMRDRKQAGSKEDESIEDDSITNNW